MLGWTAGLAVGGLAFGAMATEIGQFAEDDPTTAEWLAGAGRGSFVDLYLAAIFALFGVIVGGYAVAATMRLRSEESDGRAEPVLATAVHRARWAGSHALWAAAGSLLVLGGAGVAAGLAHGLRAGDLGGQLPRVTAAALVQAPGVWVMVAIGLALFGLAPRLLPVAWGPLALAFFVGQFGELLRLDQWVRDLSPFSHLPQLPVDDFTVTPVLWLLALATALAAAGLAGFRRRDLG